jgi:hypothetical protein
MGKVKQMLVEALELHEMNHINTMTLFNPNKHPVYSIPLSELVNLWRARYGDTWVDVSEIEDDFWSDASARLHSNKKMEELNHHSDNSPWARLKEDA